jgi:hypothetical protein
MVEYIEEPYELIPAPVNRPGPLGLLPGQSKDGYGKKITTERILQLPNKKRYRVYATCFSNTCSLWVEIDGRKLHIRN